MELDLEQMMFLIQRRYRVLQEIDKLTSELQEAVTRNDTVSASLLLDMRADQMEESDRCWQEIWMMSEKGSEAASAVRELMRSDPAAVRPTGSFEEQKIYEIRRKTEKLIKVIQEKDRNLNRRVGGGQSYYVKANK